MISLLSVMSSLPAATVMFGVLITRMLEPSLTSCRVAPAPLTLTADEVVRLFANWSVPPVTDVEPV